MRQSSLVNSVCFNRALRAAFLACCLCLGGLAGVAHGAELNYPDLDRPVRIAYLPITHALPVLVQHDFFNAQIDSALAVPELAMPGLALPVSTGQKSTGQKSTGQKFVEQRAEGQSDTTSKGQNPHIELVKFGSWPELMDALNTGRVDGASVLLELAIKAREQGIDVKAVALGHHDGNVIIATQDIETVADLKGKAIAVPHRYSSHTLLVRQMLKNAGLAVGDVRIVELSPPEMPAALVHKHIAAYCVAEPFGAKSVIMGTGKVLLRADQLWEHSICCALVFNGAFLKKFPELTRKVVSAYALAAESIGKNPEQAHRVAGKYMNTEEAVLRLSLQWISYERLALTRQAYEDLAARLVALGLSANPPTYEAVVDGQFFE